MIGAAFNAWQFAVGLPHMLASLPWPAILVGLVIGMLLGAWLKWPGVFGVLTIGVGLFFMSRKRTDDGQHEHLVGGKDAAPTTRKPRVRRDSIAKRLGIGE